MHIDFPTGDLLDKFFPFCQVTLACGELTTTNKKNHKSTHDTWVLDELFSLKGICSLITNTW